MLIFIKVSNEERSIFLESDSKDKQLKAYYVRSKRHSQFLPSFENYPPRTFVEWIIIPDEALHIEFRVTWLECGECNQALTACDQALEVSLVDCA